MGQLLAPSEIMAQYFKVRKGDTTKMGEGAGNLGLGMESIKVAMGSAGVYSAAISEARLGNVSEATRRKLSADRSEPEAIARRARSSRA